MIRVAVFSLFGLAVGLTSSVAQAQFYYSPIGYYGAPVVHPIYSAPIPVGVSYYAPAPVFVPSPVYAPIVQSVYSAPVAYAPSISYASYQPAPIAIDPVYVTAAPVVVSHSVYSPIVRESLRVRPFSTTYRAHSYGYGPSVYARSGPFRTVVRTRGW